MPGSIQNAAPSGVMPYGLCTAFSESREYVQLQAQYHDGTIERSQLAQTSRRTFKLAQRLTATLVAALKAFWDGQQGGDARSGSSQSPLERPAGRLRELRTLDRPIVILGLELDVLAGFRKCRAEPIGHHTGWRGILNASWHRRLGRDRFAIHRQECPYHAITNPGCWITAEFCNRPLLPAAALDHWACTNSGVTTWPATNCAAPWPCTLT